MFNFLKTRKGRIKSAFSDLVLYARSIKRKNSRLLEKKVEFVKKIKTDKCSPQDFDAIKIIIEKQIEIFELAEKEREAAFQFFDGMKGKWEIPQGYEDYANPVIDILLGFRKYIRELLQKLKEQKSLDFLGINIFPALFFGEKRVYAKTAIKIREIKKTLQDCYSELETRIKQEWANEKGYLRFFINIICALLAFFIALWSLGFHDDEVFELIVKALLADIVISIPINLIPIDKIANLIGYLEASLYRIKLIDEILD